MLELLKEYEFVANVELKGIYESTNESVYIINNNLVQLENGTRLSTAQFKRYLEQSIKK